MDETTSETVSEDREEIDMVISAEDRVDATALVSVGSMQLNEEIRNSMQNETTIGEPSLTEPSKTGAVRTGGHRAGFDAFMTGYIFAWCLARYGKIPLQDVTTSKALTVRELVEGEDFLNKIYLGGKDFPLQVAQSNFAKPSKLHLEKLERLRAWHNGDTG